MANRSWRELRCRDRNRCVALSSIVTGLGGGFAIADLTENSVGSCDEQLQTLSGSLFDRTHAAACALATSLLTQERASK